jgi:hypothetical protein
MCFFEFFCKPESIEIDEYFDDIERELLFIRQNTDRRINDIRTSTLGRTPTRAMKRSSLTLDRRSTHEKLRKEHYPIVNIPNINP